MIDELQAQYVACSYLSSACQEALGRFPPPKGENDAVAQRALEYILAIEWDWRQTLQQLAEEVGAATSSVAGYNATYAEDEASAREGAAGYRGGDGRRTSIRRRL